MPVLPNRRGEIPASIVYQDDRVVAFHDINPQAPSHVLVIPRQHIATLNDLSPQDDASWERLSGAPPQSRAPGPQRTRLPDGVQLQCGRARPFHIP